MPHDRNGKPLNVGDTVLIPCVVLSLGEGEIECNATVETMYHGRGTNYKPAVTLNTAQFFKATEDERRRLEVSGLDMTTTTTQPPAVPWNPPPLNDKGERKPAE